MLYGITGDTYVHKSNPVLVAASFIVTSVLIFLFFYFFIHYFMASIRTIFLKEFHYGLMITKKNKLVPIIKIVNMYTSVTTFTCSSNKLKVIE